MRSLTPLVLLAGLGLLASNVACSKAADDSVSSSEAAHTEGELTWGNEPYFWTEVSQEEIDPALGQKTAPQTHPISVRLQAWVDRFDSTVRTVVREKTGQTLIAPKPRVRLIVDPEVNAFIMGLPTCIAAAPAPAAGIDPLYVFTGPGEIGASPDGFCLDSLNWPAEASRLDWLNRLNAGRGMNVRVDSDAVVIGDGSLGAAPLRAAKVAGISGVSLVNVNAALVSELSEKAAAVVIAHELGHYYRAHMSTNSAFRYDFWFDRDRQLPERPTPVQNQAEYREQYERIKLPRFTIPGQQLHPRLGSSLVAWAKDISTTAGHPCEPIKKTVATWPSGVAAELTMATSDHDLSGAARRAYLDLETKAATCIASIKLTNDPATTTAWSTNNVSRQWFITRIPEPMKSSLTGVDLQTPTTLSALLDTLTTKAKAIDAEAPAFLKRLSENQIGLYTGEQEADDISFELSTRLGLTSADVYGSYTELMRYVERASQPDKFDIANDSMSSAECEALLAKGFRDGDKTVHVPLGTLDDPHHALCYRLFNLYRENEAHRYVPGAPNLPPATPAWADLQKQARDLLAGGPTSPQTPSTPPSSPGKGGTTPPSDPTGGDSTGDQAGGSDEASGDDGSGSSDPLTGTRTTTTTKTTGCSAAPGSTSGGDLASFGVVLGAVLAGIRRRRHAR